MTDKEKIEKIAALTKNWWANPEYAYNDLTDEEKKVFRSFASAIGQLYKDNNYVQIEPDAELPCSDYANAIFNSKQKSNKVEAIQNNEIYEKAQLDMLDAGWVKRVPELDKRK